ncbi:MAG: Na+/H+ antiporter NhaC family protein [Bacteroidales bacterium]|nr:Na+/H+ antiporter NhaC family protein [Bacteroidales bacterium]
MDKTASNHKGLIALSPLLVFLCVYLTSSIAADDFYAVPMSFSFLVASIYAICITRGLALEDRLKSFLKGASEKNIVLMICIFILAGAFAATAKAMGAIDAIVNASLHILPGNLIYAGLFLAACFISMSIGTSVGTIVALVPIASGIAENMALSGETGLAASAPFVTAIIVGGAFFGDNLSFISDTTIAATRTQGCSMSDKFKVNLRIVAPAALIVSCLYMLLGSGVNVSTSGNIDWMLLVPYLMVIVLAVVGVNVLYVLVLGIAANCAIGIFSGNIDFQGFATSACEGILSMGDLIAVTLLAGGMLELIRIGGGLDYIVGLITRRIKSKRGAELSIASLVSFANICTANNTIAIISVGRIAKDISDRFGIDPRKSASILDTFSCLVQGILPYGAQLLMASSLSGTTPGQIIPYLYYPLVLGICTFAAIILRLPRKYS